MTRYNVILLYNLAGDKILFCKSEKEPCKGLLNLAEGKIEKDEDEYAAAYRVLYEQTGITGDYVELTKIMSFQYNTTDISLDVFYGKLNTDTIELKEEIDSLVWVNAVGSDFTDESIYAGHGNIEVMIREAKAHKDFIGKSVRWVCTDGSTFRTTKAMTDSFTEERYKIRLIHSDDSNITQRIFGYLQSENKLVLDYNAFVSAIQSTKRSPFKTVIDKCALESADALIIENYGEIENADEKEQKLVAKQFYNFFRDKGDFILILTGLSESAVKKYEGKMDKVYKLFTPIYDDV